MRYAFPHLMINSNRDTSQKGGIGDALGMSTAVEWTGLEGGLRASSGARMHIDQGDGPLDETESMRQLFYFAQTRRGARKVDSGWPRPRARRRGCTRRGKQCAGNVHSGSHGLLWKVDCTHACTPLPMVRWKRLSRCAEISGRRRNECETQRDSAGAGEREAQESGDAYAWALYRANIVRDTYKYLAAGMARLRVTIGVGRADVVMAGAGAAAQGRSMQREVFLVGQSTSDESLDDVGGCSGSQSPRRMPAIQSDGRLSARHSHFVFFHHCCNPSPARCVARSSMKSVQLVVSSSILSGFAPPAAVSAGHAHTGASQR
ncbi:hypothetical protein B0H13DRAFT_1907484 [Mycena leptocephala]|nr:hypothetical protein B0H13DRAFT_1907484 [Mycena leptocephala]